MIGSNALKDIPANIGEYLRYDPDTGHVFWLRPPKLGMVGGERAGSLGPSGYRRITFLRASYAEHRVAWFLHHGRQPPEFIDHINRVRDDNRIANLREASFEQNRANRPSFRSLPKGVHRTHGKRCPFFARIEAGGRSVYLGSFKTASEASAAYEAAAVRHYGEFALLAADKGEEAA